MSALMLVSSCSASSSVHPSLCRLEISFQSLRSALSKAGICSKALRADVQNLLVECFEDCEVGSSAECNGVAEYLLCACEPCWA